MNEQINWAELALEVAKARIGRKKQIISMRFEKNMTLQEIGNYWKITREMVRQIVGNSGAGYKQKRLEEAVSRLTNKTNEQVKELLGISTASVAKYRRNTRHAIASGNLEMGTRWEEIVSKILLDNGIRNKLMPHMHQFDILLDNGKRVDVKAASKPLNPPSAKGSPFFVFGTKKPRRGNYCDFFICVVVETVDLFIIPFDEAPKDMIRLTWPKNKKPSKYYQYHNRFDLLN